MLLRGRLGRRPLAVGVAGSAMALGSGGLAGCQQNYGADVRNMTPQPVFVQISESMSNGGAALRARERLGPGDRKLVGPVRTREGRASVTIDTLPNPQAPVTLPLRPGVNSFNVRQRGDATGGPIEIEEVGP
jgi:hypothetical protein